jgi:hypothetical protein
MNVRQRKRRLVKARGPLDRNHRWVWFCGYRTLLRSL